MATFFNVIINHEQQHLSVDLVGHCQGNHSALIPHFLDIFQLFLGRNFTLIGTLDLAKSVNLIKKILIEKMVKK